MTTTHLEPAAVGRYIDSQGNLQLLPYSETEIERATVAYQERLGTCHFRTGEQVLLISLFNESAQFLPFTNAASRFGLIRMCCDASYFDAARTESSLRRFDVSAVMGLNGDVLDGLLALEHDPVKLLEGVKVWARPDAYDRLKGEPGLTLRRWFEIGPAVAMECIHGGGAHVDRIEWEISTDQGELILTNRLNRCQDFKQYRTGVRGTVDFTTCRCGSADPRVTLEA